jgi:hypothetical protein
VILHNGVVPFTERLDAPVKAGPSDDRRKFYGTERRPFGPYPTLNDIEHRKTKIGSPTTNGLVERTTYRVRRIFAERDGSFLESWEELRMDEKAEATGMGQAIQIDDARIRGSSWRDGTWHGRGSLECAARCGGGSAPHGRKTKDI